MDLSGNGSSTQRSQEAGSQRQEPEMPGREETRDGHLQAKKDTGKMKAQIRRGKEEDTSLFVCMT